jgi:4-hydroxy-tetrahydrodipicolinate reductase
MNESIIVIGASGRMSGDVQSLLKEREIPFEVWSSKTSSEQAQKSLQNSMGIIDFSSPQAAREIVSRLQHQPRPWVCGTTGWTSLDERNQILQSAASWAPVLFDSNFSLGIELLCRSLETIGHQISTTFFITDLHHAQKKDSPSGTALKIADRIREVQPSAKIEFRDIRAGNIIGEHRIHIGWNDESLEFVHRAQNKRVFSEGALKALHWLQRQKPGLYSMKDLT